MEPRTVKELLESIHEAEARIDRIFRRNYRIAKVFGNRMTVCGNLLSMHEHADYLPVHEIQDGIMALAGEFGLKLCEESTDSLNVTDNERQGGKEL